MFGIQTSFRTGAAGKNGWSPVLALVEDPQDISRLVLVLVDYTGGTGTKPTSHIGQYVGTTGYVINTDDALNLKGSDGSNGSHGSNGSVGENAWSPVYALTPVDDKVIIQVVDWQGGTGTKPALPADPYLTPTGFGTAANAVNVRGGDGKSGNNGLDGTNGTNGWAPVLVPFNRTPIEVVLQIVGYSGGTGTPPALPFEAYTNGMAGDEPIGRFLQEDGTFGLLPTAVRINPEDSFENRMQQIKEDAMSISFPGVNYNAIVVSIFGHAKSDVMAWIGANVGAVDFTQVDAMTVIKSAFRTAAYYATRGASAPELPTFPVSVVMPNFLSELDSTFVSNPNASVADTSKILRSVLRAIVDFDGELETKFMLGDVSDVTTLAEISEINDAFDYVRSQLA